MAGKLALMNIFLLGVPGYVFAVDTCELVEQAIGLPCASSRWSSVPELALGAAATGRRALGQPRHNFAPE
jgi:hypothetical protein